jgi:hypothetical protein
MLESDPQSALGEIKDVFKPAKENLIAGVIIAVALIAGGLALGYYLLEREDPRPVEGKDRYLKYGFIVAAGVLAPLGGILLLNWMRRLLSHRVIVGTNGFAYVYRGATEICLWEQIAEIREVFTQESIRILKVPGGSLKNVDRSLIIRRKDGKDFQFTVNTVKGVGRLANHFAEARDKYDIPWQQLEQ